MWFNHFEFGVIWSLDMGITSLPSFSFFLISDINNSKKARGGKEPNQQNEQKRRFFINAFFEY